MEPQHRAPAPALHQVVALTLVYQRLAVVVAAAPAAFFVLPFVSRVFLGTLQWVTRGHAVFFLLLWLALYLAAYRLIHQLASSRIALEKTLRNNATRLPLLSGWSSFLLARYVWGPVATAMAIPETLPVLSFRAAWQTALSLALLGLSVLARYVGPKSIVRCSPFPLILNPLRLWFHHPFVHLDPKDHSQLQPDNRGRRLQSPTLAATVAQCTVALIVGIVLAHINTTVLTRYTKPSLDNDPVVATAILTACIWTIAGPLVWTALDGVSHEFDPRPYQPQHHLNAQSINLMLRNLTKKLVLQSLLIPTVSIAFALAWWHPTRHTTHWFGLYTTLGLSNALVALYLGALEEALRWSLFHPPADWTAVVAQLADDSSMERQLGVLLYSVLQDTDIVAEVCRPTSRPGVTNLDTEESRRQERLIRDMSIFLSSKSNRATPEVPLEEDVLRLTILESLGGSERQPLNANASSARHNANVRAWVDWKLPKNANFTDGPPEPLIVPLVRALCVYIGGLGETLISRTQRARSEPNNTWILPPGMLTCADWALRALSRCLVFSLTGPDEKPLADWHSTHVAMLVPAAMQAIYLLRRGCQRFGHTTLVAACDDTASATIRCLTTTYRGRVDLVGLEPEPLAWVQSLVSAPSSRNSQALVVSVSHKME